MVYFNKSLNGLREDIRAANNNSAAAG